MLNQPDVSKPLSDAQLATYRNLMKHGTVVMYGGGRFTYECYDDPSLKFSGLILESGSLLTIFTQ